MTQYTTSTSEIPTAKQSQELQGQILSGRITRTRLETFLHPEKIPCTEPLSVWVENRGFGVGRWGGPEQGGPHLCNFQIFVHQETRKKSWWRPAEGGYLRIGAILRSNDDYPNPTGVDAKHWLIQIRGRDNIPRLEQLAQEIRENFEVEVRLSIISNQSDLVK